MNFLVKESAVRSTIWYPVGYTKDPAKDARKRRRKAYRLKYILLEKEDK